MYGAGTSIAIFGIDGTIADNSVQDMSFDQTRDVPIVSGRKHLVEAYLKDDKFMLYFLTGRPNTLYLPTWEWLNRKFSLTKYHKPSVLLMRPAGTTTDQKEASKVNDFIKFQSQQYLDKAETAKMYLPHLSAIAQWNMYVYGGNYPDKLSSSVKANKGKNAKITR